MSLVKRKKTDAVEHRDVGNQVSGKILYEEAVVLEGHRGTVMSCDFNGSGNCLASGGVDRDILLWTLPTREETSPNFGVLKGHKSAVTCVRWCFGDSMVVSSSADGTVGFWDGTTGKRIRRCGGSNFTINQADVTKEGIALSVGDDGLAQLWDPREKGSIGDIETEFPLLSGIFNNQGNTVYIGGIDPCVKAYDVRKVTSPIWSCEGQTNSLTSISVNHDDSMLITRSMKGQIRTYSAKDFIPEGIRRISPYLYDGAPSGNEYQLIRTCFGPESVTIVSGSEDKTVTMWDVKTRKTLRKLGGHRGAVLDVKHHPIHKIVLSTSTDGSIIVREY